MSSRHFFGANFGVEQRTAKNKTTLRGGKVESTLEYDYAEVGTMLDMFNVIINYMVGLYYTWHEDYTPIIILRVKVTKIKIIKIEIKHNTFTGGDKIPLFPGCREGRSGRVQ